MSRDLGKFSVRTGSNDRLLVQSNSNQNAIINCLLSVVRRDGIFDDRKELILFLSHVERECLEYHKRIKTNQTYLFNNWFVWLKWKYLPGCYLERW